MLDTFQTELLDTLNKIAKDLNRIAAALEKSRTEADGPFSVGRSDP